MVRLPIWPASGSPAYQTSKGRKLSALRMELRPRCPTPASIKPSAKAAGIQGHRTTPAAIGSVLRPLGHSHVPILPDPSTASIPEHTNLTKYIHNNNHRPGDDRMKDIIITSGGKNITPSEIENQLNSRPMFPMRS